MNSTKLLNDSLGLIKKNLLPEAVANLEKLLEFDPANQQGIYCLGQALAKLGKWDKAIPVLKQVAAREQTNIHALYCLAYCLEKSEIYADALNTYKQVIKLDINYWQAYYRLALILLIDQQEVLAVKYLNAALAIQGPHIGIYCGLAEAYKRFGFHDKAYDYCKLAYTLKPESKLLGVMIFHEHYDPNKGLDDFLELAEEYNDQFLCGYLPSYDHSRRSVKTKMRLGFVSADFRNHPIANYLISIFREINKDKFEIYLYYNHDEVTEKTELLMQYSESLKYIQDLDDKAAADLIYQDQIDILFDMNGFTAGERLPIFKLKPAPVQITHQGYFGTLGIPEVDYIIADDCLIRTDEEQYFTEEVLRLKSFVHADLYGVPEQLTEPACLKNGFISFGAFNSPRKVTLEVLNTWIEILKAVPNSRIIFDSNSLVNASNKQYFYDVFDKAGIARERVSLDATNGRTDYLLRINEADILLDTFPYGGGTTSLEAAMMGLAAITMEGDRWVSRMTSSYYHNIGHKELIAKTKEEYITKAIELANDIARIAAYRTALPRELKNSPLEIKSFVRDFENLMKGLAYKIDGDNPGCQHDE